MDDSRQRYEISYETRLARCFWCWETIEEATAHTVVRPLSGLRMEVRLHHKCWPEYLHLSKIELRNKGSYRKWSEVMIERFRISLGVTTTEFCRRLEISVDKYNRFMNGDASALTATVEKSIGGWAARAKFDIHNAIDWSDNRAFFCLRMHMGISAEKLARLIGVSFTAASQWDHFGSSHRALRSWARLDAIAAKNQFDRGMVVDDRKWTKSYLVDAVKKSGRTIREWATAACLSYCSLTNWLNPATSWNISRDSAWKLTRAATKFGLELPEKGCARTFRDQRESYREWRSRPGSKEKVLAATARWRKRQLAGQQ